MALTPQQEHMNQALDDLLRGPELGAFHAMLEADEKQAAMYAGLREVDTLLNQPPLAVPAPDFASKVMARIEAGEHERYGPRAAVRTVLWLSMLGGLVLLPLIIVLAISAPLIARPDAFMEVLQQIVPALSAVSLVLDRLLRFLGGIIATYPMAPALALTVIPMVMLWGWLVWYLQNRNRPQTIIVPVQVR